MYEKPSLSRFGSFREVTRGGDVSWDVDTAGSWYNFLFHTEPTTS